MDKCARKKDIVNGIYTILSDSDLRKNRIKFYKNDVEQL